MKPLCIIYYHGNDWDGVPGRQAKLMEAMSHHVPVIFLDASRDGRWRVTQRRPSPEIVVVRGLVAILRSLATRKYDATARLFARFALARLTAPYRRTLFWGAENWWQLERFVPHDVFVHDSIDPCFVAEHVAAFVERETLLARKADVVLCTAEKLWLEAKKVNGHSYLVPNACAEEDFTSLDETLPVPPELENLPLPMVGYIGSIDSRLDVATLLHAATQLAEYSFVFAGPVVPGLESVLQPLRVLPNVSFVGPKFGLEAKALTRRFAVGLIPFQPGEASDALNPVKMYTYLAAGVPVVSTWIHECVQHQEWVHAAKTPAEFTAAIRRAVATDAQEKARLVEFARRNTWNHRASDVMKIFVQTSIVAGP